jgi:bifunctional DNase/RNase
MSDSEQPEVSKDPNDVVYRVMNVQNVLYDLHDSSPAVHLFETEEPFRYLVIPISLPDATALNNVTSEIVPRRPATPDLAVSILQSIPADIISARIVKREQGIFYAELDVMTPRGRQTFDCRVSDAINFALRQKPAAPILCSEDILSALPF